MPLSGGVHTASLMHPHYRPISALTRGALTRTAAHLEVPSAAIAAALNYAEAYPREIEDAIADNGQAAMTLSRLLPEMEVFELQEDGAAPPR